MRVLSAVSHFTTGLTQNIYSIERHVFSCESWPNKEMIINSVFVCIITFFRPIVQLKNKGGKVSWTLQSIKRKNNINLLLQVRWIKYVYVVRNIPWKTSSSVTIIPLKHLKILHGVHKSPQTEHTLSKFKSVGTLRRYSIKIHFNNALVIMPSHPNGFPLICLFCISCPPMRAACSDNYHLPWFN